MLRVPMRLWFGIGNPLNSDSRHKKWFIIYQDVKRASQIMNHLCMYLPLSALKRCYALCQDFKLLSKQDRVRLITYELSRYELRLSLSQGDFDWLLEDFESDELMEFKGNESQIWHQIRGLRHSFDSDFSNEPTMTRCVICKIRGCLRCYSQFDRNPSLRACFVCENFVCIGCSHLEASYRGMISSVCNECRPKIWS